MSVLDLGVENVGEFYAEHYLATVLDQDLREVISQWERDGKSSPPWHRLRALQRPFEQLRSRASEIRDPVARWRESHAFHVSLLEALGYSPRHEVEALDGNSVVPAMLSLSREGAPWLVAFEAPIALGDDSDALDDKPLAAQLSPDVDASTLADRTWREILDEGIFARDEPEPPRWVLFLAGDELTLIDRWKWPQAACLRFDLARLLGVRTEEGLRALAALLHRECLAPDHGEALHDGLDERSHKHAYAASEDLKHGARQAVEILANEVVAQLRARNEGVFNRPTLAQELTRDCLVYLYRLLFLFYVEARGAELGVVPANNEEYRRGYALEFLRDLELVPLTSEASRNGHYLHHSLQRLFRLVDEGFPRYREQLELTRDEGMIHHGFVVPGLRSALFDTSRTKHIDRVSLRNEALQRVLACLSLTREGARQRGRISYAQLGINQLGAVYEGLLSYTGFFATDALYEVRAPGTHHDPEARTWFVPEREIARYDAKTEVVRDAKGEPLTHPKGSFLYRLAGRDREKTASYYTPEVLTRCLTKYTLQERLAGLSASDILELTVCEPAMGSGAFLNEAVTQLADAYLAKRQEELAQRIPSAQFEAERQRVKFHVATRQVYGVDLTPMAAELGKVSLWLNVLGKALPAPWFDARIATGNSLLGARREVFSVADLRPAKGKKAGAWLDKQPAKVRIGDARPEGSVWHFLVADAGMCPFDQDKVVKSLAPEAVTAIKAWRKAQSVPFEMLDEARLSQLSDRVDTLFERHVADRDELLAQTRQSIALWGAEATSPRVPSLLECEERRAKMLLATAPGERLRAVMNYWCALWFWPVSEAAKLPSRDAWLSDLEALLGLPGEADEERLKIVERVTQRMRFFHWELSFPEVFARGGFDVIVGNPPWLRVEWDETAVLADFDPTIALRSLSTDDVVNRRDELLKNDTRIVFFDELEAINGTSWFLGAAQNYPLLQGAQNNLYKCFIERAMSLSPQGAIGFVHQKGLYDDPGSGTLRTDLLRRLRWRFHFLNKMTLFGSIDPQRQYEITVVGSVATKPGYRFIVNLLHPKTIDESLTADLSREEPGIKNDEGEWEMRGHPNRVIRAEDIDSIADAVSADVEEGEERDSTVLPLLHSRSFAAVIAAIRQNTLCGATGGRWCTTREWDEADRQKDGTIKKKQFVPQSMDELILSGPHFYIATPFAKAPLPDYRSNRDYAVLDPETLSSEFVPKALFAPGKDVAFLRKHDADWQGRGLTQFYRHVHRTMVSLTGERSLVPALIPPGPAHVHSVKPVAFKSHKQTVIFNGLASSLVVDFFIRAMGGGQVNVNVIERLPCEVPEKYEALVMARVLRLNCLTVHYADLWAELFPLLRADDGFTKRDPRLGAWTQSPVWTREVALRRAYARRQALVELDALAALALGVTIDDLALVYRVQFPVLQEYERDTWYDAEGRIVFTVNKGLPGVGLSRDVWERVKNAKAGESLPGEAAKWVPPFDRCDRERDMREAYRVFGGG